VEWSGGLSFVRGQVHVDVSVSCAFAKVTFCSVFRILIDAILLLHVVFKLDLSTLDMFLSTSTTLRMLSHC
jgi:hypothetical protein